MTTTTGPRIGLIGAGGISAAHLPHLLRLGSSVTVYAQEGAEALVARFGGTVAASLDELLERADIVDVATPTPTHAPLVTRALRAGKDVISEKPLTRTVEEALNLLRVVEETGRQLYVAHVVRYFPEYVAVHDAIVNGSLGEIAVQRFSRSGAFPRHTPWFADRDASGGIVLDQMVHDLDIARWNAGEVVRVSAVGSRRGSSSAPAEVAHVLLTHESGAISHVAGVWGAQHLQFTTSFSVAGTGGTVQHDSAAERDLRADLAVSSATVAALPDVDPGEDPYFLELQEFVAAAAGGPPPRVTVYDAIAAVRIANAALESMDLGRPVDLPTAQERAA